MMSLRRIHLAFLPALALAACGNPATIDELPLASDLTIETTEDAVAQQGTLNQALSVNDVSLLRLAHEGLQEFNGDVRELLGRVHRLAVNNEPVRREDGARVWVIRDGNTVIRLVIQQGRLGEAEATYTTEDGVPAEESVRDSLPILDRGLVAFRFRLEIRSVTEDDSAFRLAARGHLVRVPNEPLGTGVVIIERARIAEVDGTLVRGRQRIALRYDHRGRVRRIAVRHAAVNGTEVVRSAWVYRQFGNRAGALKFVRWGDLPNLPVSGNQNELLTLVAHWVRVEQGLVARAFARVSGGDLGTDAIRVIECLKRPPGDFFRLVLLADGSVYEAGSGGDRSACAPFPIENGPEAPMPDAEEVPVTEAQQSL